MFGLAGRVTFHRFVSRDDYLDWLSMADIAIQLRYPLFGQVSGPVSDCVTCGVPLVTTASLALGMDVEAQSEVVPDVFSPVHVSEAIRRILARDPAMEPEPPEPRDFGSYLNRLVDLVA